MSTAFKVPRLTGLMLVSAVLFIASLLTQQQAPGSLIAVSLYKLHMASLAGWAGYWIDRLVFPYSRPHELLEEHSFLIDEIEDSDIHGRPDNSANDADFVQLGSIACSADQAMLRRAIIIGACLIAICLGA